jgi:histidine kinase/DNA gyrase B/HSP90-like ATPase
MATHVSNRLLGEIERQKKYLARLPDNFQYPLFNARQALESQRRNGYRNTAAAAREIVDNSLEAGANRIDVVFNKSTKGKEIVKSVAFIDNGPGMLPNMARYALSWGGGTHFDEPNFIGRFGFGLPNASINQTRRVEVYTRTNASEPITLAWLDANEFPDTGLQTIKEPTTSELPEFVKAHISRNSLKFETGVVVVWVEPDRLTYKTASSLKEHILDDFGTTYRYLLKGIELKVDGVEVEPVDPLFLDPNSRYYLSPDKGGAIEEENHAFAVKLIRDEATEALHLQKLPTTAEIDKIRKGDGIADGLEVLAVGVIHLKVANFPLGLVVGRMGEARIEGIDQLAKKRFEIRQARRGMSFVRAGREIETVDAFPRSAKDIASGLGDWPHLQSYAYHWGVEVKFGPELDDVFGITNDKQRVRPIEDFWKLLAEEEIDGLLHRLNTQQAKWRKAARDAAKIPVATPEASPAEVAAQVVDTVVGQQTPVPEHERGPAQETFQEATQNRAKITGESLDEAAKVVEADSKRRRFRIDFFDETNGPFYKPEWESGTRIVIWINRKHAFYETLYLADKTKLAKQGLDLFLIALGKGELTAKDPIAKIWYQQQREKVWSEFLAISMQALASNFQGEEEEEDEETIVLTPLQVQPKTKVELPA